MRTKNLSVTRPDHLNICQKVKSILKKYKKNYKNINYCLPDFFSASKIRGITKKKSKIITACRAVGVR